MIFVSGVSLPEILQFEWCLYFFDLIHIFVLTSVKVLKPNDGTNSFFFLKKKNLNLNFLRSKKQTKIIIKEQYGTNDWLKFSYYYLCVMGGQ